MKKALRKIIAPLILKPQTLRVSRIENDYDQTFSYWLKPKGKVDFFAGQYVHLVAPREGIDKATVRHMSVASSPLDAELLFSMNVASKSRYKKRFAEVKVGDKIKIFHITGAFTLDGIPSGSKVVFIAGGIGITPIRSLIRDIELRPLDHPWSLIHVGRNYLYADDFAAYDRPQQRIGRPDVPAAIEQIVAEQPDAYYFISGSETFIEQLADRVAGLGVERSKIRLENFNH